MKTLLKIFLPAIYLILLLIPGYAYFYVNSEATHVLFDSNTDSSTFSYTLFRLFGLYAMALVWGQIILGPFMVPLAQIFSSKIIYWHRTQGIFTLLLATLHPVLFYLAFFSSPDSNLGWTMALPNYLGSSDRLIFGAFGNLAWILMVLTVLTALLQRKAFFRRYWSKIHLLNYGVFIFAWLHAFNLGTEVQLDLMQNLYLFYGSTFLASISYRIFHKKVCLGRFGIT